MAVEGERGIAEQQRRCGCERAHRSPCPGVEIAGAGRGRRRRSVGRRGLAIDHGLHLAHRQFVRGQHVMRHVDEDERAGAALFLRHRKDARASLDHIAKAQRAEEFHPARRPHAARQRDGRQEAARAEIAARVAVRAQHRCRRVGQAQAPVEAGRSGAVERRRAVKRRAPARDRAGIDSVAMRLGASGPGAPVVHSRSPCALRRRVRTPPRCPVRRQCTSSRCHSARRAVAARGLGWQGCARRSRRSDGRARCLSR